MLSTAVCRRAVVLLSSPRAPHRPVPDLAL